MKNEIAELQKEYSEYLETLEETLTAIAETALVKEINYQIDYHYLSGNFKDSNENLYFCLEEHLEDKYFKKGVFSALEKLLKAIYAEKDIKKDHDLVVVEILDIWEELISNAENDAYEQCLIRGSYSIKR